MSKRDVGATEGELLTSGVAYLLVLGNLLIRKQGGGVQEERVEHKECYPSDHLACFASPMKMVESSTRYKWPKALFLGELPP